MLITTKNPINVAFGKAGKGAVYVEHSYDDEDGAGIFLVDRNAHVDIEIGKLGDRTSGDVLESPIIFKFYDPKSIDVMIEHLELCKRCMTDADFREFYLNKGL